MRLGPCWEAGLPGVQSHDLLKKIEERVGTAHRGLLSADGVATLQLIISFQAGKGNRKTSIGKKNKKAR